MNIRYMLIVLRKELKDTFRDKKTIFSSIIIPILIFPILVLALGSGASDMLEEEKRPIEVAIIGNENTSIFTYLKKHKNIEIKSYTNPEKALKDLKIKAIIKIDTNFDETINENKTVNLDIIYDESSQKSAMAKPRLERIIDEYSNKILEERLKALNIKPNILNVVNINTKSVTIKDNGFALMMFSMMLPMLLTIWSAIGGIPAATDLGAGEKERKTLEALLTTKASRVSILLGKYFTIVIAGIMGTLASLLGFLIASKLNPDFLGSGVSLPPSSIGIIAIFCVGLSLTFSGIELAISFYARNFKEAQTYLTPLTIILLIPAYLTMYLDGRAIPEVYFNIPIINIISIIKEVLVSVINPLHIFIVLLWTILYVSISIFITVRMFNKESVIFRN
ncbi:MAG: ABC transporter permease [Firmicutes bacterium]|nr:ABC transporter permease [Bacillota bacterium]